MVGYGPPAELEGQVTRHRIVSRKTQKAGRRKTTKVKPTSEPIAARRRHSSVVDLQEKLKRQARELEEAHEQQAATAEVLRVISSSPGDLEPVFQSILEHATRLCAAKFANLYLYEGDLFRTIAMHNMPPAFAEARRRAPLVQPAPGTGLARIVSSRSVVHVADVTTEQAYIERQPLFVSAVELGGFRTFLAVPMLKDGKLIGAIVIYRQEVHPFADKQIALVQNFAAQAVIAIENARLLNELRQRTTDLTESLEQQTATSEVLRVISSSPAELKPVFESLLANAVRLCEAEFGLLLLYEDNWRFRVVAMSNAPAALAELRQREPSFEVTPQTGLGRAVATRDVVHIADYAQEAIYKERHPAAIALGDLGGARTFLVVPMLKDEKIVGAIAIYRQQVRPFGDKQIDLVKNFAAKAVIAIENARLLNELKQSLEQQTATAEVLRVISSSPGDLKPVFQAMLANAVRICGARFGNLLLFDGKDLRMAAMHNAPRCARGNAPR